MFNTIIRWFKGKTLCGLCKKEFKKTKDSDVIHLQDKRTEEIYIEYICTHCAVILELTKMRNKDEPFDITKIDTN